MIIFAFLLCWFSFTHVFGRSSMTSSFPPSSPSFFFYHCTLPPVPPPPLPLFSPPPPSSTTFHNLSIFSLSSCFLIGLASFNSFNAFLPICLSTFLPTFLSVYAFLITLHWWPQLPEAYSSYRPAEPYTVLKTLLFGSFSSNHNPHGVCTGSLFCLLCFISHVR